MTIGIIGAMSEEVEELKKHMTKIQIREKAGMNFYKGQLYGKDVVIVVSGIGKVNAAICTQILIDLFNVGTVINVGVAGGADLSIKPGDIVIGKSLIQHDMDCSVFGDEIGQVPRMDALDFPCDESLVEIASKVNLIEKKNTIHIGVIATGDQFIADNIKAKWINETFNALAIEMEGASIAQTSYRNGIPFIVIRSISDNANTGAHIDFEKFIPYAVENSMIFIKELLMNI